MSPASKKKTSKKKAAKKKVIKQSAADKTTSVKKTSNKKTTEKKVAAKKSSKEKVPAKQATNNKVPKKKLGNKSSHPAKPTVTPEERRKMIAVAAYLRAEKRGFTAGYELDDWKEAEKEVDALLIG